jgi:hypothetical protein
VRDASRARVVPGGLSINLGNGIVLGALKLYDDLSHEAQARRAPIIWPPRRKAVARQPWIDMACAAFGFFGVLATDESSVGDFLSSREDMKLSQAKTLKQWGARVGFPVGAGDLLVDVAAKLRARIGGS